MNEPPLIANPLHEDDQIVLYGYALKENPETGKDGKPLEPIKSLKEVVVYRYPRVFHVFIVVEYGRRFYRSLYEMKFQIETP
jgi:hypothetical protein